MHIRSRTALLAASGVSSVLLVIMGLIVVLGLTAVFVGGKSWSDEKRSRQPARRVSTTA
ncbi:hypothetical protein OKJ48_43865 [Streptomyces kunmingensis]|uniref:Uncharacterized protein n=1 Tax=Streptomyces kunmingensis TaxID=68225 RepID=A0ABU6CT17_9ACTN|nr:hypothetical protein [Streptomyces kunmingensis]MEB3967126.1 hypothetical protein [Streptomyces kunmingensis]